MDEMKQITSFPQAFITGPYNKNEFTTKCDTTIDLHFKVCKVIILGDLCVGKTSLLNRFCHKIFDSTYKSTIGVDFQSERIEIMGIPYYLQIWDTAGQERFKCISQCYYRNAHAVLLVFDQASIKTLFNCKNWLRDVMEVCNVNKSRQPFLFLVGSKRDLVSEASYKRIEEMGIEEARKLNGEFWSVSAKTGENIDKLFYRVAALNFNEDCSQVLNERRIDVSSDLISFRKNHEKRTRRKCCE